MSEKLDEEIEEEFKESEKEEEVEKKVEEEEEEIEEEEFREEERKEREEEIVEERIYTIPLRKAWIYPRKKRAPKAIRIIRSFIERHMKPENIVITNELNEEIWSRGIEKPPRKIRVKAVKDKEGTVTLHLAEVD